MSQQSARRTRLFGRNMSAFLDSIAYSELGPKLLAQSDDGYDVIVGSVPGRVRRFGDYRDHPRLPVRLTVRAKDGKRMLVQSTAAGRYQILARYFDAYKRQLGLPDFGPDSQDEIAIQMIRECRAIDDIEAGRFAAAVHKCRSRWASFPAAGYGQHENELADLQTAYVASGGTLA